MFFLNRETNVKKYVYWDSCYWENVHRIKFWSLGMIIFLLMYGPDWHSLPVKTSSKLNAFNQKMNWMQYAYQCFGANTSFMEKQMTVEQRWNISVLVYLENEAYSHNILWSLLLALYMSWKILIYIILFPLLWCCFIKEH